MANPPIPKDPDVAIAMGQNARRILEDPLVEATLAAMERSYLRAILMSEPTEFNEREEAYRMYRLLTEFKRDLTTVLDTGRLVERKKADEDSARRRQEEFDSYDGTRGAV